jgi:hypothetical protein
VVKSGVSLPDGPFGLVIGGLDFDSIVVETVGALVLVQVSVDLVDYMLCLLSGNGKGLALLSEHFQRTQVVVQSV